MSITTPSLSRAKNFSFCVLKKWVHYRIGQWVRPADRLHDNSWEYEPIVMKILCIESRHRYLDRVRRWEWFVKKLLSYSKNDILFSRQFEENQSVVNYFYFLKYTTLGFKSEVFTFIECCVRYEYSKTSLRWTPSGLLKSVQYWEVYFQLESCFRIFQKRSQSGGVHLREVFTNRGFTV
jgi:hypothetical protein